MIRYATSKFRLALLAILMVGVVFGLSRLAMAQSAGAPAPQTSSGFALVFHILDWMVIVILISCSIGGVALAIDAFLHIKASKIAPIETTEHLRSLINSRQFKELMDFSATDPSFVSQSINAGIRRAHLGYPAMRESMESAMGEQTSSWFRRIELLNIIGNTGPLIGLLGTVLGMIIAFQALKDSGGAAKPTELAGGISTALWHTFGGLFVAIPCLVVFGVYRTKIDKICSKAALISEELLESLRPEDKKSSSSNSSSTSSEERPSKSSRRSSSPQPQPE
jgi:biopolymer transport protein ExbB